MMNDELEKAGNCSKRTAAQYRKWFWFAATYGVLLMMSTPALLPFLWMISTSLKVPDQISAVPPRWIPNPIAWSNYSKTWNNDQADFALWTRNTLIVSGLAALGTCISSAIVAYGFARIRFRGRGFLFAT